MREVAAGGRRCSRAEYGGVNSSEHGDGLARASSTASCSAPSFTGAMVDVKRLFDPDGVFNPGKIVDAPPMTENCATRPAKHPVDVQLTTRLDFSAYRWFSRCRRPMHEHRRLPQGRPGVMCPSYMATREEQHSTRGRANALVKALSRPTPRPRSAATSCTRSSTSASSARPASPSARWVSTWPRLKSETLVQRHAGPRDTVAVAGVRRDRDGQPCLARRSRPWRTGCCAARRSGLSLARTLGISRAASAASARTATRSCRRWMRGDRAGRRSKSEKREDRPPGRLVHHLQRARDRPGRGWTCWRRPASRCC